jgi:hypothetical protein
MSWVCRLIANDVGTKKRVMQPNRHLATHAPVALRCVVQFAAVERVTSVRRSAFSSDDEDETGSGGVLALDEVVEFHARCFEGLAMEIDTCVGLNLAAGQFLRGPAVECRKWRRFVPVVRMDRHRHLVAQG